MDETDDDVGDLDAGVVDVVLDFNAIAGGLEDAHEGVAEHCVANVTDVRGLVRIDARVLDHLLLALFLRYGLAESRSGDEAEEFGAIEENVDVARTGDLDARDLRNVFEPFFQLFGDG